jgi:hypothetical protein
VSAVLQDAIPQSAVPQVQQTCGTAALLRVVQSAVPQVLRYLWGIALLRVLRCFGLRHSVLDTGDRKEINEYVVIYSPQHSGPGNE